MYPSSYNPKRKMIQNIRKQNILLMYQNTRKCIQDYQKLQLFYFHALGTTMKAHPSFKYVKNSFFTQNQVQDYEYAVPSATFQKSEHEIMPDIFKEVQNLDNKKQQKKYLKRNLCIKNEKTHKKTFFEGSNSQNYTQEMPKIQKSIDHFQQKEVDCNELTYAINKKAGLILNFEDHESDHQSKNEQIKEEQIDQSNLNQNIQITNNIDKLLDISFSASSEHDVKIQEIQNKQISLEPIQSVNYFSNLQMSQEDVLFQKLDQNIVLHCLLRRDKQNKEGVTEYNIYTERQVKHLLTIKKDGSTLDFYQREVNAKQKFVYNKIATFQSNILGNKYSLFRIQKGKKIKNSLLTVCYQTNFLGLSGPRKIEAYIPNICIQKQYLNQCYQNPKYRNQIEKCINKLPKWNQEIKSYVLNFKNRAKQSSIKNLVMTDDQGSEDKFYLIFAKIGNDTFNLDISKPFSFIQGVALALTTFGTKIVCD